MRRRRHGSGIRGLLGHGVLFVTVLLLLLLRELSILYQVTMISLPGRDDSVSWDSAAVPVELTMRGRAGRDFGRSW